MEGDFASQFGFTSTDKFNEFTVDLMYEIEQRDKCIESMASDNNSLKERIGKLNQIFDAMVKMSKDSEQARAIELILDDLGAMR